MGRPSAIRRSNPEVLRQHLVGPQRLRFEALVLFCNQIDTPEVHETVNQDELLFSTIVDLAVTEYRITQKTLGDRINKVSSAAVGRWQKMINLPPPYVRAGVIKIIVSILREHIANERAREKENDLKGQPTLLRGCVGQ